MALGLAHFPVAKALAAIDLEAQPSVVNGRFGLPLSRRLLLQDIGPL
jgi:hypothetical protein